MEVDDNILARIYSFDLKFGGGKRTQFYRKFFGFKAKRTREDRKGRERVYENFYPGVLTPLPHLRLGKSVVALPKSASDRVKVFFDDSRWRPLELHSFDGILPPEERMEAMRAVLGRVRVGDGNSLRSEIESLRSLSERGGLSPEEAPRVKVVLEHSRQLMNYDWTDEFEFSKDLRGRIEPLEDLVG